MKDIGYTGVLTGTMGFSNFLLAVIKQTQTSAAFGTYCKHVQKRTACIKDYGNCMTASHLQTAMGVDQTNGMMYAVQFSGMGNLCTPTNEPIVEKQWICLNTIMQKGMTKYNDQVEACAKEKASPQDVCAYSQAALACSGEPIKACGTEIGDVFCQGTIASLKAMDVYETLAGMCKGKKMPACKSSGGGTTPAGGTTKAGGGGGASSVIPSAFVLVAVLFAAMMGHFR